VDNQPLAVVPGKDVTAAAVDGMTRATCAQFHGPVESRHGQVAKDVNLWVSDMVLHVRRSLMVVIERLPHRRASGNSLLLRGRESHHAGVEMGQEVIQLSGVEVSHEHSLDPEDRFDGCGHGEPPFAEGKDDGRGESQTHPGDFSMNPPPGFALVFLLAHVDLELAAQPGASPLMIAQLQAEGQAAAAQVKEAHQHATQVRDVADR